MGPQAPAANNTLCPLCAALLRRYIATSAQDHRYHLPRSLQEFRVMCSGARKPLTLLALLHELREQSTIVFASSLEITHKWVHSSHTRQQGAHSPPSVFSAATSSPPQHVRGPLAPTAHTHPHLQAVPAAAAGAGRRRQWPGQARGGGVLEQPQRAAARRCPRAAEDRWVWGPGQAAALAAGCGHRHALCVAPCGGAAAARRVACWVGRLLASPGGARA